MSRVELSDEDRELLRDLCESRLAEAWLDPRYLQNGMESPASEGVARRGLEMRAHLERLREVLA
jgi:hypothetical protein